MELQDKKIDMGCGGHEEEIGEVGVSLIFSL